MRRSRNELAIESAATYGAANYEYVLHVPGQVAVPELRARIEAKVVQIENVPESEHGALLDPKYVGDTLMIRNWRAGDRYWPAHTEKERKVKELLADLHATGAKKKSWAVATNKDGTLVWMRDLATPASLQPRTSKAVWIREITTQS